MSQWKHISPRVYGQKAYRKFRYRSGGGKNPDPTSKRSVLKGKLKRKGGEKGDKSLRPPDKGTGEKGGPDTVGAPRVTEFSAIRSLDNEICDLDGTNLRNLRDELGLCAPGVIAPAKRLRKPSRG